MPNKTLHPRRDVEHNVYTRKEIEDFLSCQKNMT